MTRRKLAPEEAALWSKVIATVRPMEKAAAARVAGTDDSKRAKQKSPSPSGEGLGVGAGRLTETKAPVDRPHPNPSPRGEGLKSTLDGTWDRNLARGQVYPESSVDLHGLSLSAAYERLDRGLADAIARGDRVLLLVTGKPPRPTSERPHARGAIRAAVGDWLAASRHSSHIAAVRAAHPRHGGAGALYIVLRRAKTTVSRPKS